MGENSSAASAQKPHDLKRVNLGSYQKAPLDGTKKSKKRKVHTKEVKEGSNEVVLGYDIKALLSSLNIEESGDVELPERDAEIKLTVSKLSSTGEGLAVYNGRVYTVPFGVPGDQVTATVRRHNDDHSVSKIISIDQPSPDRDDSIVGCGYFGTCNGCQFQMLPYAVQLEHKRKVVQRAFKNFSNLPPELIPEIGVTMPSPLQYGYRTKLTPHFNGPRRGGFKEHMPVPNIGFFAKDPAYVMDIEDCPIGTDTVRDGITERRTFVKENLTTAFKRGATLLLRESTMRTYLEEAGEDGKKWIDKKLCITDHNARSIEYIGDLKFDNPAGSFFQNNNSILESFTAYIRENLNLPVVKKAEGSTDATETAARPKYLVDAYCGSGLFTITCGEGLEKVWGIDVDKSSIESARKNAKANNIENADFIGSTAEDIFGKLTFPGLETSLIIDPPRKGCDKRFLDQLLDFAPKRVVYVSCNVHTQARDIGYILSDEKGKGYRIDSIRGCDFFPQTYHVEGVAVMTKID
ncbi:S-adenosyl-L-methionine-dependent methyltransferase [Morchella conica CCBAS932]|uniref:S-adenosyl-L-methionine-dependent methyltransferase n=1 Tax=Morchella conica CCBAS932 TaxID=1392247 RepID=A0A3N4KML7_9PEZI|nr:S-adenosyl-L-methionine-dependent methyltransferase [Morchella conica CCBAS932]